MGDAAIVTDALTKTYGARTAVDGLSLEIPRGEIFGLLGPNGAGKTTTILMLLGLTTPTRGRALVAGLDPVRNALEVRRRVGYLPDAVGFYDDLTGRQNLRYTARLNRLPRGVAEDLIDEVATEVGLADRVDDRVRTYSRGMRQRLGLADALLKDPEVLVLDEPTTAIDPEGVREVLALIRGLPERRGCTVLLCSHLLQQVEAVCDRVGIFVSGRLVASGTVDELARGGDRRVVIEVDAVGGDAGRTLDDVVAVVPGVLEVRRDGGRLVVDAERDVRADVSAALHAHGFVVTHLSARSAELDDVYHRYFAQPEEVRA